MTEDVDGFREGHNAERKKAERRYVAALRALDAAAEPSTVVGATAAAAAADVARLNDVWQQPQGPVARILTELGRMLPWRRRKLHGAMIAAINRNTETTRALIDATQQFQSHLIWYAQTVAAFSASSRRETNAGNFEAMNKAIDGIATHWMMQWDSLQAREERYRAHAEALAKAYEELQALIRSSGTTPPRSS